MIVPGQVTGVLTRIENSIEETRGMLTENLAWLKSAMHPYFFLCNGEEVEAVAVLAADLHLLTRNHRFLLADSDEKFAVAQLGQPGALTRALRGLADDAIVYAQMHTSYAPLPGCRYPLQVVECDFAVRPSRDMASDNESEPPPQLIEEVRAEMVAQYGAGDPAEIATPLGQLWKSNKKYVRTSPPPRLARLLHLLSRCRNQGGVSLDVEVGVGVAEVPESRLLFGVANPPGRGFLVQVFEVLQRLGLTVRRTYCLTMENDGHPYFLATFYVATGEGGLISPDSPLFARLRAEIYAAMLMPMTSPSYEKFVAGSLADGPDTTLIRAFIGFCHTQLAHTHPDSFDLEGVSRAFHNHPELTLQLVRLFHLRFDPEIVDRQSRYEKAKAETSDLVENFSTGRRFLDQFRRTIFRCCLLFVTHTLKSNFFIAEKRCLAFRLDPAYLGELGAAHTEDLPADRPFRISYFTCRTGSAYHIGFSDIARGGWRTILTQGRDDYVTAANTLFKETFVLAHTQHLKNKDIYEGGSKMVAVLRAEEGEGGVFLQRQLHLLQHALLGGFLDLFVTSGGRAADSRIVDYYGEDEPIELGPDENMHDTMIEQVAKEAVRRGYILGSGIMSSKQVGINHKEYGVTSTGVIRFAEVALATLGIDIRSDPFRVIFTGGPNGDVAGNCLEILMRRCSRMTIPLILDGSGALVDRQGIDLQALAAIVLRDDIAAFDPLALHPGGFVLYRQVTRRQGMQELFKKVSRSEDGLIESWISNDEFYSEYDALIFSVPADLFIPAGGRPETIDSGNWRRFLQETGEPSCRVIVEGANSFISPEARRELQQNGVILMRDASANKCGVIASSYEIIANLLLSDEEFLAHKGEYVSEVLAILEKRAGDEAAAILRRHREAGGTRLYTDISNDISREINQGYARLFGHLQANPRLCAEPLYRRALLDHLPPLLTRADSPFADRIGRLPEKITFAILAAEIASSMVYHGNRDEAFFELVEGHLKKRVATSQEDRARELA